MKGIIISSVIAGLLLLGAIMLSSKKTPSTEASVNNVSVIDGKQIVEIKAKGGYQPRTSVGKAGIPTVIRFNTDGTFDCSASVRIPSLNISKILPQSGSVDIDIGIPQAGILRGTCGMGMYPFAIDFRN
jgi:plastocyanin domain-containing protein